MVVVEELRKTFLGTSGNEAQGASLPSLTGCIAYPHQPPRTGWGELSHSNTLRGFFILYPFVPYKEIVFCFTESTKPPSELKF